MNNYLKKIFVKISRVEYVFVLYFGFVCYFLSLLINRLYGFVVVFCYFYFLGFFDTLVFLKKGKKIFIIYLIIYLVCNKVVLIIVVSEFDVFELVFYIWLIGIYVEFYIVKFI